MEKISVIIPVYNNEETLPRCISSVLRQTYKNLQVLIIDDGSTDCSDKVINEYVKKDKRVELIKQKNRGVSEARNIGIQHSIGKYITFVDADDYIDLNMYEVLMKEIINKNNDLQICSFVSEYSNRSEKEQLYYMDYYNNSQHLNIALSYDMVSYRNISKGSLMGSVCRCLIKKSIIDTNNISFRYKIKLSEDLLFLLDVLFYCKKVGIIDRKMYHYVCRKESATQKYVDNSYEKYILVYEEIIKKSNFYSNIEFKKRCDNLIIRYTASAMKKLFHRENKDNCKMCYEKMNYFLDYEPYKRAISKFKFKINIYLILKIKSRRIMFLVMFIIFKIKNIMIDLYFLLTKRMQKL